MEEVLTRLRGRLFTPGRPGLERLLTTPPPSSALSSDTSASSPSFSWAISSLPCLIRFPDDADRCLNLSLRKSFFFFFFFFLVWVCLVKLKAGKQERKIQVQGKHWAQKQHFWKPPRNSGGGFFSPLERLLRRWRCWSAASEFSFWASSH